MSAIAIRQAPGWWASLCRAECDDCGWRGPVRDSNSDLENVLLKVDKGQHECGEKAGR